MWAVEKFDKYLLGIPFTLHTDQHALQQVLGSPTQAANKCKTSKFIHWAECLSACDFMLAYRPGKENYVPDMLSWLPLLTEGAALQNALVTCMVSKFAHREWTLPKGRHRPCRTLSCRVSAVSFNQVGHTSQCPSESAPFLPCSGRAAMVR